MSKLQQTRRTQAERTRASKEKIIQAASEFFAQQGYRGAKMADIAKAANLTEPGLLHHFASKTHLLMAVLAERDRVDRERFGPSLLGEMGNPLSSLQKLVEYNETVPGLVQLFTILVAESIQEQHPAHNFFMQRYQNGREQDIEVLRQGQAQGEIRSDIPAEDLTIMLYAMMDGLQIQWLFEPEKIDMARIFGQFVRLLRGE
ncbi:MAG: TetR/AcrR family transcriptional regulator [Chloroflexi bacterium]|nr:TetR/AcrR family transcriptional regulator [Chloroflexota bacterium]